MGSPQARRIHVLTSPGLQGCLQCSTVPILPRVLTAGVVWTECRCQNPPSRASGSSPAGWTLTRHNAPGDRPGSFLGVPAQYASGLQSLRCWGFSCPSAWLTKQPLWTLQPTHMHLLILSSLLAHCLHPCNVLLLHLRWAPPSRHFGLP